ncbi:MAG: glycosyl hydrolase family 8 [Candidatus Melainabacteria bacterium]
MKKPILSLILGLVLFLAGAGSWAADRTDWSQWNLLLNNNWADYRHNFIQEDGRVIDHRIGISTSEGQAYAMLRAVWMRDRDWFDRSYRWAVKNLQVREGDKLFAWKWGQLPDQSWGVIDNTSATDADQDIVMALLLASEIWKDDQYRTDALAIMDSLWEKGTLSSKIGRVMMPGDWQIDGNLVQINPSYFAPYAYRIFARMDKRHPWQELVETSYAILQKSVALNPNGLPPDWVAFNTTDGSVKLYRDALDARSDYGYEAIRVYWRVGFDYLLNPTEKRALTIMTASQFLPRYWIIRGDLPGATSWDGIPRKNYIESAAVYGASLMGVAHQNPEVAQDIIDRRIVPNLQPGGQWNTRNDYYSQNWLWFGLATHAIKLKKIDFPKHLSDLERLTWVMSFEK